MNRRYILLPWLLSLALLTACGEGDPQRQAPDHGHDPAVEQERGPHGGACTANMTSAWNWRSRNRDSRRAMPPG